METTRHSREQIMRARQMYADGVPVDRIFAECGMSKGSLYYWVDGGPKEGEWHFPPLPRRREAVRRRPKTTGDRVVVVDQIVRTAEAQVHEINERLLSHGLAPGERDREMRALAVLAKTLRDLGVVDERKKGPRAKADDDDGPRDIDEFRRELARRMDAIVAARTAAVPGEPEGS